MGLFLLPIIVWQGSVYPFVAPKVLLLQILTALIFVAWLYLLLNKWYTPKIKFSWLGIFVLLFFVAIFASSILGENFGRSFWGRSERMTGLFIVINYGILFLVWREIFSKEQWYRLWQWFVGLGIVAPIIAIFQIFNSELLLNSGSGRVGSTLGNPIFLAGFAAFLFFSSLIFYNNKSDSFKYFWLIEIVLSLVAIFATQTRGDLVGLYVGLIFLLLFFVKDSNWSKIRKLNLSVLVFLIMVPALLFSFKNYSVVKDVPALNRFVDSPISSSTGGSRLLMWKTAVVGWKQKPVFGWGWENFFDLFNKNYLPEFSGKAEDWQDNAHNVFFNLLATIGVVGLSSYLFVYFYAFYLIFKNYKQKDKDQRFFSILLGAFWISHFIRNLFVFEEVSSYLVFFWLLAGVDIYFGINKSVGKFDQKLNQSNNKIDTKKYFVLPQSLKDFLFIAVIIFVCFYIFKFVYLPAKADYYAAQAVKQSSVDIKKAMDLNKQAASIPSPYHPDIIFEFGQYILGWLRNHPDFVYGDHRALAKDMYDFGTEELESYRLFYPNDTRVGTSLGSIYGQGYDFWNDAAYLERSVKIYEDYLPSSPNRQTLVFGLVRAKMLQGKDKEALEIIEQFISRFPEFSEPYWMESLVYAHMGDNLNSFNFAKKALEHGYEFSSGELLFVFDLFNANSSVSLLEEKIMDKIFNSQPTDFSLVDKYINYLNKNNKKEEANYLKLRFSR